jgi:hypothetical protein
VLMLAGGIALVVIGLAGIKWYVWDIAISQAGQPDRSMLFWGLPILFLAFGSMAVGGLLGWTGLNLAKRGPGDRTQPRTGANP